MNSFKTSNFRIHFDREGRCVVIADIDSLAYDDALTIAEVDSICDRHWGDEKMTNKERIKVIAKSAEFFYR